VLCLSVIQEPHRGCLASLKLSKHKKRDFRLHGDTSVSLSHPIQRPGKWLSTVTVKYIYNFNVSLKKERPPIRRVAANKLNKQSRTANEG